MDPVWLLVFIKGSRNTGFDIYPGSIGTSNTRSSGKPAPSCTALLAAGGICAGSNNGVPGMHCWCGLHRADSGAREEPKADAEPRHVCRTGMEANELIKNVYNLSLCGKVFEHGLLAISA